MKLLNRLLFLPKLKSIDPGHTKMGIICPGMGTKTIQYPLKIIQSLEPISMQIRALSKLFIHPPQIIK